MKTYILYNPMSGNGMSLENANIIKTLNKTVEKLIDITSIEDYSKLFSELNEADSLIICGGDGTLNRFVNDTEKTYVPCKILYCASGTGNDFLKDLGIENQSDPIDISKYLKDLPFVTVNGKKIKFLNNVGFGIDGYCCEVGDKLKNESTKPVNYTSIAIKGLLFHFKPCNAKITVDGEEFSYNRVWLAPTMKGRYYGGGMMPTPSQNRTDENGTLSLMVFHGSKKLRTLMMFPSIFKGEHLKYNNHVKIHTGKEITVRFDKPCALQIDGETILGVTEYTACACVNTRTKAPQL